ncbi:hypothetical protein N656DRAFT_799533 [Canariomyces notabilis]|uniref:Uncharacterized protein n=1 Tax=Canariomyces notabilis TaxID=2074819 RepID=A0AAN6TBE1_9PEZI|nr:hypothetical protein N656DRAFT_799533 [Canariomyces arenarius]
MPVLPLSLRQYPQTPEGGSSSITKMGQFDWFGSIGATPEAVAVLNDQPHLFTILIIVLIAMILQCVLIWYIHYATLKPEQKVKKDKKDNKKPAEKKPPARR